MSYLLRVGTSLSQLVNTVILNGDPDESISGRSYRLSKHYKSWMIAMKVIDKIFFWELDHCKNSFYFDLERARKLIEEYDKL